MPRPWRACLVGCGRMGATIDDEVRDRPNSSLFLPYSHAAGYTAVESTTLVAVSDTVAEKAEAIRQRYHARAAYTDYREMIEREKPDIVSIATRPTPYAEICCFAAEHGVRGIYCEKPLARSMAEADRMVEACERNGVKFNYGTQRRYAPQYRKVCDLIAAGELGKVECVLGICGASAALWGLTHATDMLLCLAGDPEVEFVQATTTAKPENWDGPDRLNVDPGITNAYVRFANGVHAYLVAGSGYEFEVLGSEGKFRVQSNGCGYQWRRGSTRNELLEDATTDWPRRSGTTCLIEDLVKAIETGGDTLGNIRLAHRSFEITMGIIESDRLDGARVPLPLEHRELYVGRPDW